MAKLNTPISLLAGPDAALIDKLDGAAFAMASELNNDSSISMADRVKALNTLTQWAVFKMHLAGLRKEAASMKGTKFSAIKEEMEASLREKVSTNGH
jgi:hypothetical protein